MPFLVDDLFIQPLVLIVDSVHEQAQKELLQTEDSIREKLFELQFRYDSGGLSDAEYEAEELVLVEQLRAVQEANETATPTEAESAGVGASEPKEEHLSRHRAGLRRAARPKRPRWRRPALREPGGDR